MKKFIITGCNGFIGMHLSKSLLEENHVVVGIDNMNDYYDQQLKKDRLRKLERFNNFIFHKIDIRDKNKIDQIFLKTKPCMVVNLAAQAGVRYSITNPNAYIESNILGFMNILEASRNCNVQGLIYASSSSVYGGNKNIPFSEKDNVDRPISIYAASKKSNELMAHSYSHLFQIPSTGLRFFTVYGPWGRPDMAPMIFAKAILQQLPIKVFNNGQMFRDFTYIDDVVDAIESCCYKPAIKNSNFNFLDPSPENSFAPVSYTHLTLPTKA